MSMVHIVIVDDTKGIVWHFYVYKGLITPFLKKGRDGWVINPPKPYRIRVDKPKDNFSQKHIHIYKNDKWVVINQDGTRRHADGKGIRIPDKLYDWIKENFPDFDLPKDHVIQFKVMFIP